MMCKYCEQHEEYKWGMCQYCVKFVPTPKHEVITQLKPLIDEFVDVVDRLNLALKEFTDKENQLRKDNEDDKKIR
jgi:hypothetical protein